MWEPCKVQKGEVTEKAEQRGRTSDSGLELSREGPDLPKGRRKKIKEKEKYCCHHDSNKAWTSLPRKAVQPPLLEVFKTYLYKTLSTLGCDPGSWAHLRLN